MSSRRPATWERSERVGAPPPWLGQVPPGVDPREVSDWFRRMDGDAQDAVRARWVQEQALGEQVHQDVDLRARRGVQACMALFLCLQLGSVLLLALFSGVLGGGMSLPVALAQLTLAAGFGLLVGVLSELLQLEQLGMAVLGATSALALGLTQAMLGLGWPIDVLSFSFLAGGIAGYMGLVRSGPVGF